METPCRTDNLELEIHEEVIFIEYVLTHISQRRKEMYTNMENVIRVSGTFHR